MKAFFSNKNVLKKLRLRSVTQTANNGPVWPASVKFPRNIFQLLGICFPHFFSQIFIFSLCDCLASLIDEVKRSDHRYEIVNCQWWWESKPGKNQVSKNFPLCTKRIFSWLSKNFPRTRSLWTERVFSWLLARLIDICLPIPNWKHPLACRKMRICKNLVAVIFLSLPTLLQLNLLSAVQKPFKILRTYMNGAILIMNWLKG